MITMGSIVLFLAIGILVLTITGAASVAILTAAQFQQD